MKALMLFVALFGILTGSTEACAGLVISEIMNNPSGNDGSREWFEIFNTNHLSVNLGTIRYDDDSNASDGQLLSGTLLGGHHAIIGSMTQSSWETRYGTLPSGAIYSRVTSWQSLGNGIFGDTISLYSTVSSTNIFSITYGSSTAGRSLNYTGSTSGLVTPYSYSAGRWQNATTRPSGSTDYHTAGMSNLQAAPEPTSLALAGLAAAGLAVASRLQRRRPIEDLELS